MKLFSLFVFCVVQCFISLPCFAQPLGDCAENAFSGSSNRENADLYAIMRPISEYAEEQEKIFRSLETANDERCRFKYEYILGQLWHEGLLRDELKSQLTQKYYHLALLQVYGKFHAPNFAVQNMQKFPFPNVYTSYTPTLYKNGQIDWAAEKPTLAMGMANNSSTITSQIGGHFKSGDVIKFSIKLEQVDQNQRPWSVVLWTNEVRLQGLLPEQ